MSQEAAVLDVTRLHSEAGRKKIPDASMTLYNLGMFGALTHTLGQGIDFSGPEIVVSCIQQMQRSMLHCGGSLALQRYVSVTQLASSRLCEQSGMWSVTTQCLLAASCCFH